MAIKISALPALATGALSDVLVIEHNELTKTCTVQQFFNEFGIYVGSGAPSISALDGSLYMRSDGTNLTTLYVKVKGAWIPVEMG